MNPLVPTSVDMAYLLLAVLLAVVSFVLLVVALVMVWREEAEERDISRALVLSILTLFVPVVGAIATLVNVKRRKEIRCES